MPPEGGDLHTVQVVGGAKAGGGGGSGGVPWPMSPVGGE